MKKRFHNLSAFLLSIALAAGSCFTSYAGYGSGGGTDSGGGNSGHGSATADSTLQFRLGGVVYLSHFGAFFEVNEDGIKIDAIKGGRTFNRRYMSGATGNGNNFQRMLDAGIFYTHDLSSFLFLNPTTGTYVPVNSGANKINIPITPLGESYALPTSTTWLTNGTPWAESAVKAYGDAGGKLESLMAATKNAMSTVGTVFGKGLSGMVGDKIESNGGSSVSVDASALTDDAKTWLLLSNSEVKAQLEHYLEWWVAVYNQLGTVEAGVYTPEQIKQMFTQAVSDVNSKRGVTISSTLNFGDAVKDYQFVNRNMENYPCIGIDYIVYRTGYSGCGNVWRAMTWPGVMNYASSTLADGGRFSQGWGNPANLANIIGSDGRGQKFLRSPGLMFANGLFQGVENLQPASHGKDANAGYQFFGYYGAISINDFDDPPPPPPDEPENPPEVPPSSADDIGTYYLMDYEMNHIFDSMAEHYQDSTAHDHAKLNPGICTTDPSDYDDCGHGNNDYDPTEYYEVTYREDSGSGKSVDMDNSGPTKLFLHNNGNKGGTWWLRDEIKGGQSIDSNSVGDYVIDYGFNLLRKHFDDARGYSKIIAQAVSKSYLEQTLGMYEAIMVNDTVKKITPLRDSYAKLGPTTGIQDNLAWSAQYTQTNSTTKYETYDKSHIYYDDCGDDDDPCPGHTCEYLGSRSAGSIQAFAVHGGTPSTYSVTLYSIAHKYQTGTMPTGYSTPKDTVPFDYRPTTNGDGSNDDNQYRGTNTIDPGTTVEYVPEVPMLVDEVPGPELDHQPKKVTTVGEEKRKSKLILMTIYRMTGASDAVKGAVYTDTAVGGDAGRTSQAGNLLALTSGGDFTVKADTNMKVNLYGYALDLIEPGDAGYDTVTLNNDVKAGWGNSGSRAKLMETYQTWAAAMLNPKNYQADFEMTIGSKKYNSFSATVGSFSSKASQSTETGQYNIHVKHGKIQEDAGYNAFINQLAQDYGCSESEAKQLFKDSDMASAIIKAIEHDESSANKSNPAKYVIGPGETGTFNEPDLASQIGGLGNSSHWYDEEVRVFVIRRFMTPAATINNIIAMDKMDIGTSMEALGSDKRGSFNLNVWFRDSCYTRAVEQYYPSTGSDNKNSAIAAGDLIVAGVYVKGADFNITSSTTATGKH